MEKLLPHNLEAECGVLGSIIIDPDAITQVADFLYPRDFYRDIHGTIYDVIRHLYQEREPADFITICDELQRRNKLEEVGGAGYITSLINQVPTSGNVEYYGHIVERMSILRRLIAAAGSIAALGYDESDADAALDKAEQLLFLIRQSRHVAGGLVDLSEIIVDCVKDIDQAFQHRDQPMGVPTGFTELDEILGGGLQKTDLTVIAARPGMGKSSLALNIAHHAAMRGISSAVFSLEMGKKQLGFRLLSHETGIPTQRMRNGWLNDDDKDAIVAAQDRLDTGLISIDDTAGSPVLFIRNELRKRQNEKGAPVGLVVVDYLQLMEAPSDNSDRRRSDNRTQIVDQIVYGLKNLAKEFDVPVLALAQLSRAVESRAVKIPQLSDLRESGAIEQAADNILFIYRDDCYAGKLPDGTSASSKPNIADILIAKQRNGDTGEIELYWSGKQTRFFNSKAEWERAYA
jgi:replicative DNA helicase